jgi:hypothetical protein
VLRPSRRLIIGTLIVAFWAAIMGHLTYREVVVPRLYQVEGVERPRVEQDLWMGIYVGDDFVGFINSHTNPADRDGVPGYYLGARARLKMAMLGRESDLAIDGTAWLSEAQGLQDFNFSVGSSGHEMKVRGEVADGVLLAELETAGETLPFRFPVGNALRIGGGMAMPNLDFPDLDVGDEAFVETFDPTTMSMGRAKISCIAKEPIQVGDRIVDARIFLTTLGGVSTRAWVSPDGEVVKAQTPFGFTLRKISPEEALTPIAPTEQASLIRTMAVRAQGGPPPPEPERLTIQVHGVPGTHAIPQADTQRQEGNFWILTRPVAPGPSEPDTPLPPDQAADALGSDAFITADHERIRAQAAEIVGDAATHWDKALRIHDWVYAELEKVAVLSVPSALEVLRVREGDCNEHTILFVALARAAGVPAKAAIGLVWSEALDAFGYHAWPEVHAGGRWIPMDPTFGQPLADATHLKLLEGGIDRWTQLLPYIGQIEIDLVPEDTAQGRARGDRAAP